MNAARPSVYAFCIALLLVLTFFAYTGKIHAANTQIGSTYNTGTGKLEFQDCATFVAGAPPGTTTVGIGWYYPFGSGTAIWASPTSGAFTAPPASYMSISAPIGSFCSTYGLSMTGGSTLTSYFTFGGGPTNGNYYAVYGWYNGTTWTYANEYASFTRTGGVWNGVPVITDFSTRIVPKTPLGPLSGTVNVSTTTASTTVSFSADYFYSSTTPQTAGFYYDKISLRLNRLDAASSSEYAFSVATDTLATVTQSVTLPSNSAWGYYWGYSGLAPWGRIDGLYSATQDVFVISNPIPTYIGTSTDNLTGLATSTCSVLNVSGCFQNAISFLFWPQQTTFDQFKSIQGNVRSHAPFGYIFLLNDSINNIDSTASSSFSVYVPTELQTTYFTPLKNALSIILFALTGFWFYKRVRDLHL